MRAHAARDYSHASRCDVECRDGSHNRSTAFSPIAYRGRELVLLRFTQSMLKVKKQQPTFHLYLSEVRFRASEKRSVVGFHMHVLRMKRGLRNTSCLHCVLGKMRSMAQTAHYSVS